jgi:hypothetical protein
MVYSKGRKTVAIKHLVLDRFGQETYQANVYLYGPYILFKQVYCRVY